MAVRAIVTPHEHWRRLSGYTVTALAEAVGVSHAYVSQVEGGHTSPSPRYRKAVAEILGVQEQHLFLGDSG